MKNEVTPCARVSRISTDSSIVARRTVASFLKAWKLEKSSIRTIRNVFGKTKPEVIYGVSRALTSPSPIDLELIFPENTTINLEPIPSTRASTCTRMIWQLKRVLPRFKKKSNWASVKSELVESIQILNDHITLVLIRGHR